MAKRKDAPRISRVTYAEKPSSEVQSKQPKTSGKRGRRRRRSSNTTSNDTASDILSHESPPTQKSPDTSHESRPLRETEPETYHIYATSDQSDVEEVSGRKLPTHRNSFTAVNESSQQSTGSKSAPDVEESDDEDLAPKQAQSKRPEPAIEIPGPTHERLTDGEVSARPTTKVPPPKVNAEGRFLCPHADVYNCEATFLSKKSAVRHAPIHTAEFACTICKKQLGRKSTLKEHMKLHNVSDNTIAEAPADRGGESDQELVPKTTVDGRFACPYADLHNCEVTFATERSADRHAAVHTTQFVCVVCKKQMGRKDTLKKHMERHSAQEIEVAEAVANGIIGADQEQVEEHRLADVAPVQAEVESDVQETQEEETTGFATPQETSQDGEDAEQDGIDRILQGAQDLLVSEINEPEPVEDVEKDESEDASEDGRGDASEDDGENAADDAGENASERQSTSPPSVFDEDEDVIVKETPIAVAGSKCKRRAAGSIDALQQSPERNAKRRKSSPNSPPTSVPSNDLTKLDTPKVSTVTGALRSKQITDKITPRLQQRQSSMDGWAQKYTPGSNLKHPALNPTPPRPGTQRVEVVMIRTSQAGPSGTKLKRKHNTTVDRATHVDQEAHQEDTQQDLRRKKPRKSAYSTSKGKKRAEPGVEYSTPTKEATTNGTDASDDDTTSPINMATSVAMRTFPRQEKDQAQTADEDEDEDFDTDQAAGSDADVSQSEGPSEKRKKATKTKVLEGDRVECLRCHRQFTDQGKLDRHLKRPSAHDGLSKCLDCNEEFYATTTLARHEKDTGHGKGTGLQGRTGLFSQKEVDRLNKWRDRFCEYHNISRTEFNDMMTGTVERGKGGSWSWQFIKRAEFLKEYIAVLPNRNKRSMLRYRERNFQNVEGSKNWTAEDDQDLIRLQKELGSKWAEIARRLTRTSDAVSQRWRHKLQYGNHETGEWSKAENNKFGKILDKLHDEAEGNELEEYQIPWNRVSEQMGSRSAQQCSNHYRALHSKKSRGRWVKIGASEKTPGSSRILTPSKMELRLSGENGRRKAPRKGLSEEFVRDDDDEADEDEEGGDAEDGENEVSEVELAQNEEDAKAAESASEAEDEDEPRSPIEVPVSSNHQLRNRNPINAKTPGKTLRSSQLFEQTQANTSGLKPSQPSSRKLRGQESQDRPSPNIPIQRRRLNSRSPLKEIRVLENGDLDRDDDDEESDEAGDNEGSQELATIEEAPHDDESEVEANDEEDAEKTPPEEPADEDEIAVKTESDVEEDESVEASDNGEAVKTESDDETSKSATDASESDDEEAGSTATDEEETQSADAEDQSEEEDAAPAEEPTSSFMNSINASAAKRANIKKARSPQTLMGLPVPRGRRNGRRQVQQDSDDESD